MQKQIALRSLTYEDVEAEFGPDIFERCIDESRRTIERVKAAFEVPSCETCKWAAWASAERDVGIMFCYVEDCKCPDIGPDQAEYLFNNADIHDGQELAALCGHWSPDWEGFILSW